MCVQTNLTASCDILLIYIALQNLFPEMYLPPNSIKLTAFNLRQACSLLILLDSVTVYC